MAISRKTFNTVKDILKELDERRSAARPESSEADSTRNLATPKRPGMVDQNDRRPDAATPRNGVSDQLIG